MFVEVNGFPSWYRSVRFREMGADRWVATCGRVLLFVRVVESGDASYLWEVEY